VVCRITDAVTKKLSQTVTDTLSLSLLSLLLLFQLNMYVAYVTVCRHAVTCMSKPAVFFFSTSRCHHQIVMLTDVIIFPVD
jgi:hypothetical protein